MPAVLMQARLKEKLFYDPATGEFWWHVLPVRYRGVDRPAGTPRSPGDYLTIKVDYGVYYSHRLAWLYVHGTLPNGEVDHIDGDKQNNRIANLRLVSRSQNAKNRRLHANNTSGAKGVRFEPDRGRYLARIAVDGRNRNLGRYLSFEDAKLAYARAAQMFHGEFANLGVQGKR